MDLVLETNATGDNVIKDLDLGKKVLTVLERHYAGHDWFVNCCHESGVVTIQLMYEGQDLEVRIWKYGMVLHIPKLMFLDGGQFDHKIKMTGGELLERYNMARAAVRENSLVDFFSKGIETANMVM
jgi:hypothetical protein